MAGATPIGCTAYASSPASFSGARSGLNIRVVSLSLGIWVDVDRLCLFGVRVLRGGITTLIHLSIISISLPALRITISIIIPLPLLSPSIPTSMTSVRDRRRSPSALIIVHIGIIYPMRTRYPPTPSDSIIGLFTWTCTRITRRRNHLRLPLTLTSNPSRVRIPTLSHFLPRFDPHPSLLIHLLIPTMRHPSLACRLLPTGRTRRRKQSHALQDVTIAPAPSTTFG